MLDLFLFLGTAFIVKSGSCFFVKIFNTCYRYHLISLLCPFFRNLKTNSGPMQHIGVLYGTCPVLQFFNHPHVFYINDKKWIWILEFSKWLQIDMFKWFLWYWELCSNYCCLNLENWFMWHFCSLWDLICFLRKINCFIHPLSHTWHLVIYNHVSRPCRGLEPCNPPRDGVLINLLVEIIKYIVVLAAATSLINNKVLKKKKKSEHIFFHKISFLSYPWRKKKNWIVKLLVFRIIA